MAADVPPQKRLAKTSELLRRHGISAQTFYAWKRKYGELSERSACRYVGVHRTLCRCRVHRASDEALRERIKTLAQDLPRWGVPRLVWRLHRHGWPDTHKRIERIDREEGLAVRRRLKKRVARPRVVKPAVRAPNDRWSMEFVRAAAGAWSALAREVHSGLKRMDRQEVHHEACDDDECMDVATLERRSRGCDELLRPLRRLEGRRGLKEHLPATVGICRHHVVLQLLVLAPVALVPRRVAEQRPVELLEVVLGQRDPGVPVADERQQLTVSTNLLLVTRPEESRPA